MMTNETFFVTHKSVSFDIMHKTLQLICLLSAFTYRLIKWRYFKH